MARRDLSNRDASDHAASELEYIIRKESREATTVVPTVTAEQAMRGNRVFTTSTDRDVTRVLFISRNNELLNPTQQSLDGYINISELFDEVHILILRQGIKPQRPVLRVAENVWIYTAAARYWWQTPAAGMELIEDQLEFAHGFRPDLVVARDPFESAIIAHRLHKKHACPIQLHVLDDFSTADFLKQSTHNFWRVFLPHFTIPKFVSVRALTDRIKTMLQEKYTIPDMEVLPRYQDYTALIEQKATLNLKEKYKPLIFFLLFVGKLGHESTLYRALDAARFVLRNRRVGMVVLGDGQARSEFERRAKLLGIDSQVIFETRVLNVVSYMKSSHILIVTDTDTDSEEVVLQGAAAGIPMVMSRTEQREDIFTHGESAFLCQSDDVQAFTDRLNDLLNDIGLRKQFVMQGQDIIRSKFHNDPDEYLESYRSSIEQAFFIEADVVQVKDAGKDD